MSKPEEGKDDTDHSTIEERKRLLHAAIKALANKVSDDKLTKKGLATVQKKENKIDEQKIKVFLNSPLNEAHSLSIEHQVNGGIGGHRHQHGIPGGRYSAHGATSSHGGRRRSKPKGKGKGKKK